jgi:hypothetical protein
LIHSIADPKVQQFIESNLNTDTSDILLKHRDVNGVPTRFIVDQINGRLKAKGKFARLLEDPLIIYPPSINLEQSSSQATAEYKTQFLKDFLGHPRQRGIDLTGGFGIDALFMSDLFETYDYVEEDTELYEIAKHNLGRLKPNLRFYNTSAEHHLDSGVGNATLVYIDPSRRNLNRQKVVGLQDCRPNILALQNDIFRKAEHLVVKASPLLDIDLGASQLNHVKVVLVLSVFNECRELVFVCERNYNGPFTIQAVNITQTLPDVFKFSREEEAGAQAPMAEVAEYLYEPNAAIRKAGAFKLVTERYGLFKLHVNTHLYTSAELREDFPGRIFRLKHKVKSDAKIIGDLVQGHANVITKNYPLAAEALKKKMKLRDGGENFLIGFTGQQGPQLVVADRVQF